MQQFTRKPRRGEESVSLVVGSRQPRRRILVLCDYVSKQIVGAKQSSRTA